MAVSTDIDNPDIYTADYSKVNKSLSAKTITMAMTMMFINFSKKEQLKSVTIDLR